MAFTYTWDDSFEATPADGDDVSEGALRIRDTKKATSERLEIEHDFKASGKHLPGKVTVLQVDTAANLQLSEKGLGYASDEKKLYKGTASGKEVIDLSGQADFFPSGTKMLFYQDTAPSGWTIQDTLDDKLVFITKGSAAGGQTGGTAHSSGSWTISGLSASTSVASGGDHYHLSPLPYYDTSDGCAPKGSNAPWGTGSGPSATYIDKTGGIDVSSSTYKKTSTDGAHTHTATTSISSDATWRPACYCCIICAKD